MIDQTDAEYIKRKLGELEGKVDAARAAVSDASMAEFQRFEARVEGWSTLQTVAAAVATFAAGVVIGGVVL